MSLTNSKLTEEGNTLSQILLPSLNYHCDYTFLQSTQSFILNRFLNSLITHIKDTQLNIQKGFILFSISLDIAKLQEIIFIGNNLQSLAEALEYLGYDEGCIQIFIKYPGKLLWKDLLIFLKSKENQYITEYILLLSKLTVVRDPGNHLKILNNIFAQRRILLDIILQKERINLCIEDLIEILDNLRYLEIESINQCLQNEPDQWKKLSLQFSNQEQTNNQQISIDQLTKLYNEKVQGIINPVTIEQMSKISQEIGSRCFSYRHNLFQSTISAIIASLNYNFIIAIIPTGSGKTYIQGILAKFYCLQEKSVTIIEPTEQLQVQTSEKVGPFDYNINIYTTQQFFQYKGKDEVIILDEYDEIISNQTYHVINNKIEGVWFFKEKKVIAFSATTNHALEKFVNNSITKPFIIQFPSEYEFINGISAIQIGNIQSACNANDMFNKFLHDLDKTYEVKPIIVIAEQEQIQMVSNYLQKNKFRHLIGANENNLTEIRGWDYGVLVILPQDARGLDTRFGKDSHVLIIASVDSEMQYQQLIGRSSRTRGISEGVLYIGFPESQIQVIQRLRKQNFTLFQDLEKLVKLLSLKQNNQSLIKMLTNIEVSKAKIKSLDDLSKILDKKTFTNLIKDIGK